jgi:hypothetical protein
MCIQIEEKLIAENLRIMLEISGYMYTGALVQTSVEAKPITQIYFII